MQSLKAVHHVLASMAETEHGQCRVRSIQDQYGANMGPIRGQYGANTGTIRGQCGANTGPIRGQYGVNLQRPAVMGVQCSPWRRATLPTMM